MVGGHTHTHTDINRLPRGRGSGAAGLSRGQPLTPSPAGDSPPRISSVHFGAGLHCIKYLEVCSGE